MHAELLRMMRHVRARAALPLLGAVVLLAGMHPGFASATPRIAHWTLPNGAQVYFVETHELPILQVSALFDAGTAREDAGQGGVALLSNALLQDGADRYDADAIAEGFESVGAEYSSDTGRDWAAVGLRVLSDPARRDAAAALLSTLLAAPRFPESALARERERVQVALRQMDQSPEAVAERTFYQAIYGNHPYARVPQGTERSLGRITRAHLVRHHRRFYVGSNLKLVVVGDVTRGEAELLAKQLVGRLPRGKRPQPIAQVRAGASRAGRVQRIAHPASQTHIFAGQIGMSRTDPDYFPLLVGNHVLGGGGLVSRISNEIREKRGLSYGASSYFYPLREPGPYMISLQTRNAQVEEALTVLHKTLDDFVAEGPTAQELDAAKKNLTGGFPLRLDSNRKIADQVANIAAYGLPLDYLDQWIGRVDAVSVADVRRVFRARVHPASMHTVIVGGAVPPPGDGAR